MLNSMIALYYGNRSKLCIKKVIIYPNPYGEGPASVAQLDACPTGDQKVAGSTPAEVGNILSWRLIMKYFLQSFSPFH